MFSKFNFLFILFLSVIIAGCGRQANINQAADSVPPAVPDGLRIAYASDGLIALEWQNNVEADLSGYNIYRSTDSLSFSNIGFTSNNYYFDDSLNYNTTYYYKITAVNISKMESQPTSVISAKPINRYPPSAPRGLSINARNYEGKLSVYLSWIPNSEGDIAGFNIYKGVSNSFTADSSTFIGFTNNINFSDTLNLSLYTHYYYRIKAVDKGGLLSDPTYIVNDEIYGMPQAVFPQDGAQTNYFNNFLIKAIAEPAAYQIIVQDNVYFGQFWSTQFSSSIVNDTISVNFNPTYLDANYTYYWRIATYSPGSNQPNSISPLYKFIIKQ